MLLLMASTLLDYFYGFSVASPNRSKAKFFLWLSIINNLGILAVFKYYNFFAIQVKEGLALLGMQANPLLLDIALPVGISFYTFHGMSYVFDIYRNQQKPIKHFVDYAVFVSFFPLLVAGPIERAGHLLPQVQADRRFSYPQALAGCRLILWGLFKKVIVADTIAGYVNHIFLHYETSSAFTLLIGAIGFSFQIYGDFSGYSDIALGTAKLFGFELLSNFKFPYFSRDIAEFWRRWHISLSSWFRDYLYIPLGGSRVGKSKAVRNTFIIFIVSGFWHGASWNFIAWGFLHACAFLPLLLLNKNRQNLTQVVAENKTWPTLKELGQMLLTFTFVTFAWIFFRAETIHQAIGYITRFVVDAAQNPMGLFQFSGGKQIVALIIPLLVGDWYLRHDERNLKTPRTKLIRTLLYTVITLAVTYCLLSNYFNDKGQEFIYFQF